MRGVSKEERLTQSTERLVVEHVIHLELFVLCVLRQLDKAKATKNTRSHGPVHSLNGAFIAARRPFSYYGGSG